MPHLYIRPKSLSLLDLLSVPLFSPLTFPNRIPVPSSSPITLLQGVSEGFYSLLSYSPSAPICPSWTEEAPTPHTRILPASFDSLVASLGHSSRCQSPQRKVGVLTVCCQHAAGVQPPVTVYVLIVLKGTNAENLQQFKVYNVVLLFFFFRCLIEGSTVCCYWLWGAPSLYGLPASLFIGILKVTLKVVLYYWCVRVSTILGTREDLRRTNR